MENDRVSTSFPVPKGRIRRASSFGKIAMKFASSIVVDGTKELVGGRSPSLKNLLIQEKNVYHSDPIKNLTFHIRYSPII